MGYYDDSYVQDLEDEVEYLRELVQTQERTISGLDKEVAYLGRRNRCDSDQLEETIPTQKPQKRGKGKLLDRVSVTIEPRKGFEIRIKN